MSLTTQSSSEFRFDSDWLCTWARTSPDALIRECADPLKQCQCSTSIVLQPTAFDDLTAPSTSGGIGLSRLQARALITGLQEAAAQWQRLSSGPVAVFWDLESIAVPSTAQGTDVVEHVRKAVERYGVLRAIKMYAQALEPARLAAFTARGCELHATPPSKHDRCSVCLKKEVADQSIIADMLLFAWHERPPATLVLITDDADFSKTLTRLHDLGYRIVLVHARDDAKDALLSSADIVLHWKRDVLKLMDTAMKREEEHSTPPPPLTPPSPPPRAFPYEAKDLHEQTPVSAPPSPALSAVRRLDDAVPAPSSPGSRTVGVCTERSSAERATASPGSPSPDVGPYSDLVHVLRQLARMNEGRARHLRSYVGQLLTQTNPVIYERLGKTFKTYVLNAVDQGVARIGGINGDAWIELTPEFR